MSRESKRYRQTFVNPIKNFREDEKRRDKYWVCPSKLFGTKCVEKIVSGNSSSSSSQTLWPSDKKTECDNSCGLPSELQHFLSSSFLTGQEKSTLRETAASVLQSTTTDLERKLLAAIQPENICRPVYRETSRVVNLTESEIRKLNEENDDRFIELHNLLLSSTDENEQNHLQDLIKENYRVPVKTSKTITKREIIDYKENDDPSQGINFITQTLANGQNNNSCDLINELLERLFEFDPSKKNGCINLFEKYEDIISSAKCSSFVTVDSKEFDTFILDLETLLRSIVKQIAKKPTDIYQGLYYDYRISLLRIFSDLLRQANFVANSSEDGSLMNDQLNQLDEELSNDEHFIEAVAEDLLSIETSNEEENKGNKEIIISFLLTCFANLFKTGYEVVSSMLANYEEPDSPEIDNMIISTMESEYKVLNEEEYYAEAVLLRNLLDKFYADRVTRNQAIEREIAEEQGLDDFYFNNAGIF